MTETSRVEQTYIVQEGDYLLKIAETFGINVEELFETNRKIIGSDKNLIRPGQKLRIPGFSQDIVNTESSSGKVSVSDNVQQTMLYDFFAADLWEPRVRRISSALEITIKELKEVIFTIDGFSQEAFRKFITTYLRRRSPGSTTPSPADLKRIEFAHLWDEFLVLVMYSPPALQGNPSNALDFDYQVKQLLNIYTLWLSMKDFWRVFGDTSIKCIKTLNEAQVLPPGHQIRECFQQFTIDFEIVQSAIQQRRLYGSANEPGSGYAQAESLVITDKLALMALAPFQHLLPYTDSESQIIPITYFSKKIHIRQLPYTDQFILVGLTYDLASSIRDEAEQRKQESVPSFELMAIPHEVGHFLYHHIHLADGATVASVSKEKFEDNPYYHWCEELFADIYGCVIAGPFAVLGLQALLATSDKERALLDNQEHPMAIFRPYFLSEMLRVLGKGKPDRYAFAELAMYLDANWTAIVERWGFVTEGVVNGRPGYIRLPGNKKDHFERGINIETALTNVRPIIETFAKILLAKAKFEPWVTKDEDLSATIPWFNHGQTSLNTCIQSLQEFSGQKIARKKVPLLNLSKEKELNQALKKKITSMLREIEVYRESKLFQTILEGWHDSGPHGIGGHD